MRDILLDIINHLDFVTTIKISGTNNDTIIETYDKTEGYVVYGKLKNPESQLIGSVGIHNSSIGLLKGLLNFSNFKKDTSKIISIKEIRNDKEIITGFKFIDEENQQAIFRTYNTSLIQPQPTKKSINWNISFEPEKNKLQEFNQLSNLFGSSEKRFSIKTENGFLRFWFGDEGSTTNSSYLNFTTTDANINNIKFNLTKILSIFKFGLTENIKINIASKGILMIELSSNLIDYTFYFLQQKD